jgi:hypothetical protein
MRREKEHCLAEVRVEQSRMRDQQRTR